MGYGYQVEDRGRRVAGFGLSVSGFVLRIPGFASRVSCCGVRVETRSGFQVDLSTVDVGIRVQGSGFPVLGCGWRMDHSGPDLFG